MESAIRGMRTIRTARALALWLGLALTVLGTSAGAEPASAQVPGAPAGSRGEAGEAIRRALESRTMGSAGAQVVVFEIADFQCPYCARFAETVAPAVHERYVETGDVQWLFVNLPLQSHPLAWHAAEAALCAGAAGDAFWPMHDLLFARQATWGDDPDPLARFADYADELGVPAAAYGTCTAEDQVAPIILQDVGSAVSAGVTGTPTFIIMKEQQVIERLVGVQPVEEWARVLDAALEN